MSFLEGKFEGLVDYGAEVESEEDPATHVLVFMLVALNQGWKLPFAHFFTSTVKSQGMYFL